MNSKPTLIHDAAVELPAHPGSDTAVRRGRWARRLLKILIFCTFAIAAVNLGASQLLRPRRVRTRLDARLAATFGRPVQVNSYSFTFWGGPTLQAEGVRVGEDPRFGHEYFLYADSLAVKLRWMSLLHGRFELQSLSLTGPTLNVVNDGDGYWNLAAWLGRAPSGAPVPVGPVRPVYLPRFREISVDGGRVNFKRGDEKLPFAFTGVSGTISSEDGQRWNLDLEASPWRAAELLQEAGTIHVAGTMGGTSSALRPAALQMQWSGAAISDLLRLLTGDDSGVRGTVAIAVNAVTTADGWSMQGHAQLDALHRWDLAERPDTPSLSVSTHMKWDSAAATLMLSDIAVDGARSRLRGAGQISWAKAPASNTKVAPNRQAVLQIESGSIDFADAFSWLHAFRPNVPDGLRGSGLGQVHGSVTGWPIRVDSLAVQTSSAQISGPGISAPIQVGAAEIEYSNGSFSISPTTLTLSGAKGGTTGTFRVETLAATRNKGRTGTEGLHLSGSAANSSDVIAAAAAFGWTPTRDWQLTGPLHCDLLWPRVEWPWTDLPTGTISLGGAEGDSASLRAPFLNLPITGLQLRMDLKTGAQHVALDSAHAFGALWSGTFERSEAAGAAGQWGFNLNADRLDSGDLDRWLNPSWRENLLDRMLPFLNSTASTAAYTDSLRGEGQVTLGQFSLGSFVARNVTGDLAINGRDVSFNDANGQIARGHFSGTIDARLGAVPNYDGHFNFSGVDVGALGGEISSAKPIFGGVATGTVRFSTQGTSRANLADSLECNGAMDLRNGAWHGVDFETSVGAAKLMPGDTALIDASGEFECGNNAIALKNVVLVGSRGRVEGDGTIDFSRQMDVELRAAQEDAPANSKPVRLSGDVTAPEFSQTSAGRGLR